MILPHSLAGLWGVEGLELVVYDDGEYLELEVGLGCFPFRRVLSGVATGLFGVDGKRPLRQGGVGDAGGCIGCQGGWRE